MGNIAFDILLPLVFAGLSVGMLLQSRKAFRDRSWRRWETLSLGVTFAILAAFLHFLSDLTWKATKFSLLVSVAVVWWTHSRWNRLPRS